MYVFFYVYPVTKKNKFHLEIPLRRAEYLREKNITEAQKSKIIILFQ